jgi:hypothetical protein
MKKLFIIAFALCGFSSVQAQYFEHLYGRQFDDALSDGKNTVNTPGFVIAGEGGAVAFPASIITLTHTDLTGVPYFNNEYELYSSSGSTVYAGNTKVFEYPNSSAAFGVVGRFYDPSSATPRAGIYYFTVDAAGNPINSYEYRIQPVGGTVWEVYSVTSVALSASGNEAYITGSAQTAWTDAYIFILKIDIATGNPIWGNVYDFVTPSAPAFALAEDIIESPFTPEVMVVGTVYSPGLTQDAFFLPVDANTGAAGMAVTYGSSTTWDYFTSISIANQVGGFVIGGYISPSVSSPSDFWLNLVDAAGNTVWANQYDYSFNPGTDERCYDVIERLNTSAKYEYYMGGTAFSGVLGSSDALIVKTDDAGNSVGEFSYGDVNFQQCYKIDQLDGTGNDGLSIFGMGDFSAMPGVGAEMYIRKVYFNGESACNQALSTSSTASAPSQMGTVAVNVLTWFNFNTLSMANAPINDKNTCFAWHVPGGSNARTTPDEPKGDKEAVVTPNPMQQGSQTVAVGVNSDASVTAQVAIYDMLGRCYYNNSFELIKGSNSLHLDISAANMAAGMYTVKITGTNISDNILLVVK